MSKFQVEKDIAQYIKKEVCQRTNLRLHLEDTGTVLEHQALTTSVSVRLPCRGYMALHCWKEFWKLRHTWYASAGYTRMIHTLTAVQKRSTLSTFIWDIARSCFSKPNNFGCWRAKSYNLLRKSRDLSRSRSHCVEEFGNLYPTLWRFCYLHIERREHNLREHTTRITDQTEMFVKH